jgi:hypothetical protein
MTQEGERCGRERWERTSVAGPAAAEQKTIGTLIAPLGRLTNDLLEKPSRDGQAKRDPSPLGTVL